MPNKRIRKKWTSCLTKDARKIAKRFKIPRQEVGFAPSGTIVESTLRPDGVREITDFRLVSVSLVPPEQTLHPSWYVQEVRRDI